MLHEHIEKLIQGSLKIPDLHHCKRKYYTVYGLVEQNKRENILQCFVIIQANRFLAAVQFLRENTDNSFELKITIKGKKDTDGQVVGEGRKKHGNIKSIIL